MTTNPSHDVVQIHLQASESDLRESVAALREEVTRLTLTLQGCIQALIQSNRELGAELAAKTGREAQRWVSTARAAEMLGLTCEETVIRRIKKGHLAGRKTGDQKQARWEVDVMSIERSLNAA